MSASQYRLPDYDVVEWSIFPEYVTATHNPTCQEICQRISSMRARVELPLCPVIGIGAGKGSVSIPRAKESPLRKIIHTDLDSRLNDFVRTKAHFAHLEKLTLQQLNIFELDFEFESIVPAFQCIRSI